ncbi:AAA family ATPase [Streptomyces sp. 3211]|uniref:AAA family ATPase n=1 Tax=Streptomyces sp. 3211 TaxID=1964449 RepID=UPI001331A8AD|nr:AAA family ATPase [Streptomyces sp. 3211]
MSEISLVGGVTITPPSNGMTLFIGPNNCGKSLMLKELETQIGRAVTGNFRWIQECGVRCAREGTGQEFLEWLTERGIRRWSPNAGEPAHYRTGSGQSMPENVLGEWWERDRVENFLGLLASAQWTDNRLQVASEDGIWDPIGPGNSPVQQLCEDRDLETAFSALMEQAFEEPVVVDRYGGQTITLRVGRPGVTEVPPPSTPEVIAAFRALPLVREQGDGFKAFTQILLHTMIRPTPVVIIDEPEAFLHPPQARLLGRMLASMRSPSQVFVATHSADFLAGVLDAETDRELALVRLDRSTPVPTAKILEPATVRELLHTPLLRYSNIVTGLFHDRVVLCESEGDCQFYAATFDVTRDTSGPNENTIFLHTSGKDRLADTARRLRTFGIPTAAIADFDLLNDYNKVRSAMEALGSNVRNMAADVKTVNDHANAERRVPTIGGFRKEMQQVLVGRGNRQLTEAMIEKVNDLIKGSSGWGSLKKSGLNSLNGEVFAAAERLLKSTAAQGLFLVPVGELEQWVRGVPSGNKAKWLAEVFNGKDRWYQNPTDTLRDFCQQIRGYLEEPGDVDA